MALLTEETLRLLRCWTTWLEGRPNDAFLIRNRNITQLKPTEPVIPVYLQKAQQATQVAADGERMEAGVELARFRKPLLLGAAACKRPRSSASGDEHDQEKAIMASYQCPVPSSLRQPRATPKAHLSSRPSGTQHKEGTGQRRARHIIQKPKNNTHSL